MYEQLNVADMVSENISRFNRGVDVASPIRQEVVVPIMESHESDADCSPVNLKGKLAALENGPMDFPVL